MKSDHEKCDQKYRQGWDKEEMDKHDDYWNDYGHDEDDCHKKGNCDRKNNKFLKTSDWNMSAWVRIILIKNHVGLFNVWKITSYLLFRKLRTTLQIHVLEVIVAKRIEPYQETVKWVGIMNPPVCVWWQYCPTEYMLQWVVGWLVDIKSQYQFPRFYMHIIFITICLVLCCLVSQSWTKMIRHGALQGFSLTDICNMIRSNEIILMSFWNFYCNKANYPTVVL